jgi:hypothetical protein
MNDLPNDPLDALRHADPVRGAPVPSASRARVRARIEEVRMTRETRPRRLLPWSAGLAGLTVVGVIAAAMLVGGRPAPPASTPPEPAVGSCVETYDLETLLSRDFAFDGTVTSINGDEVAFEVAETFIGDAVASVTLTAEGMTGSSVTSSGVPSLRPGQRYLVAGDDRFAWACGFTQPYDAAVAAQWAEATR